MDIEEPDGRSATVEVERHQRRWPWRDVDPSLWKDWHWQLANRITTLQQLKVVVRLTPEEELGVSKCLHSFRMAITPYFASLMDPEDPDCPIRRQMIPDPRELVTYPHQMDDPLHEDVDSPVPGLTHRYPDRVLLLVTNRCASYCRHCTRRRLVGVPDTHISRRNVQRCIDYIKKTPSVRDVLLSGGDALLVSDEFLEQLLGELRAIPHVEIIRIGTRVPVVLPQRITPELCRILANHHPIWLNTQFNHPKEITEESARACAMLADAGVPLGNQSVLLKGVNDCWRIQKKLCHELLKIRVRPYYLYQCDLARGLEHFRTPVAKGIEIMEMLRGHTSGLGIPTYVVDVPGGGGKIPLGPQYLMSMSDRAAILRNYEGVIYAYPEPIDGRRECNKSCASCGADDVDYDVGLAKVLEGRRSRLEPFHCPGARARS